MKKLLPILMAFAMTAVSLTGCASGSKTAETSAAGSAPSVQAESLESADASASAEETAPKTFLPKTLQTALRITPKALSV